MSQPAELGRVAIGVENLEWDPAIGKGQYANTMSIAGSDYEVVLDFSFRGAVPGKPGQMERAHNIHVARIILSLKAADQLRDLLNRSMPSQGGT